MGETLLYFLLCALRDLTQYAKDFGGVCLVAVLPSIDFVDANFADSVELQPGSNTYQFDEIIMEFTSQKYVYEVVPKLIVESIFEGYNETVIAYGQTSRGKTFTLGWLGEEDTADSGIMVHATEDILVSISSEHDSVTVSYLPLYMEIVQDLLVPGNDNIPIVEDPKIGDASPGATLIEIKDQKSRSLSILEKSQTMIMVGDTDNGVWQESNAERALESLKEMQCEKAKVPADIQVALLKTTTLRIEQSVLIGESMPVIKSTYPFLSMFMIKNTYQILQNDSQIQEASLEDDDTPLKKKPDEFGERLTMALRCLALAYKDDLGDFNDYDGEKQPAHMKLLDPANYYSLESSLIFVGIVGLRDPTFEEVHKVIENCREASIQVMVITGDNKSTADVIC
eukprot:Gb_17599 [translate_table: standard]